MLAGQQTATRAKGKNVKTMNQEVQLIWNAVEDGFENRRQVEFMYSPGNGLTDIDFHPITALEWKAMKSPTADAIARLQVVKETTVPQLQEVIRQIAEKGGYKTIVTTVGM
jgi:predicted NodU family carbamoyl transferase